MEAVSDGLGGLLDGQSEAVHSGMLTEADAVEIWIARWLRVRRKELVARYRCDPRQLYAIWWGERFPASRAKAEAQFRARHPGLVDRVSFGYRRIPLGPRSEPDEQMNLFAGP